MCYGNNIKCADECISRNHGQLDRHECTTDGVTECLSTNTMCNGRCPEGTFQCGRECRPNYSKSWYQTCGEDECISSESPCNGTCPDGRFLCGNRCKDESRYRDCNGSCRYYWYPCNGVCQNNTQSCGKSNSTSQLCLPDDDPWASDYYKQCGDECISADQACDIHISVEVYVQDVSITYSNDQPQECEPRNLGIWYSGNTIDIPFLPVCGNMTISAGSIYFNCQYNGPQINVVIEEAPGGGCGGNCGGCNIKAIII